VENMPYLIIKNKKTETMHCDRWDNISGQKYRAKGSRKRNKIQEFMYRDTVNVEHEMYDYAGNNWSHRNNNKRFKQKFGSRTTKTFNRFTTKDSYTWNTTRNTERSAV
jgi:flagellar basal body rod protein FlgB